MLYERRGGRHSVTLRVKTETSLLESTSGACTYALCYWKVSTFKYASKISQYFKKKLVMQVADLVEICFIN